MYAFPPDAQFDAKWADLHSQNPQGLDWGCSSIAVDGRSGLWSQPEQLSWYTRVAPSKVVEVWNTAKDKIRVSGTVAEDREHMDGTGDSCGKQVMYVRIEGLTGDERDTNLDTSFDAALEAGAIGVSLDYPYEGENGCEVEACFRTVIPMCRSINRCLFPTLLALASLSSSQPFWAQQLPQPPRPPPPPPPTVAPPPPPTLAPTLTPTPCPTSGYTDCWDTSDEVRRWGGTRNSLSPHTRLLSTLTLLHPLSPPPDNAGKSGIYEQRGPTHYALHCRQYANHLHPRNAVVSPKDGEHISSPLLSCPFRLVVPRYIGFDCIIRIE